MSEVGNWWRRRRKQKYCFHHQRRSAANDYTAQSWIKQELIDLGRRKMFWCDEKQGGCGKTWIV